jgi:cell division protein FtsI/penicillin-binding protein 2
MFAESLRRRLWLLSAVLLGLAFIIIARLFCLQVFSSDIPPDSNKPPEAEESCPRRGLIIDRNGYLLALNAFDYEISASPNLISDPGEVAERLSRLLGKPKERILAYLLQDRSYVLLETHASEEVGEEAGSIDGIYAKPRPKRAYPEGDLAAYVLGFVDTNNKGYGGVEGYYDELLKGESEVVEDRNPSSFLPKGMPIGLHLLGDPTLVLTIDRNIQYIAMRELARALAEQEADSGTIIVMEPKTGAVLAMVSLPTYDPNRFAYFAGRFPRIFVNPAIGEQHEPGSVFKVITFAAALDSGVITPDTNFYDKGVIEMGGCVFVNWDRRGRGLVTMRDVLAYSLNVGAVDISIKLGPNRFYAYLKRFGFGRLTGIDLEGEVTGRVKFPWDEDWYESDLGANSFGQGIAVTPLQMINAVAAVANRGVLMKPYVVDKIIHGELIEETEPSPVGEVISPKAAEDLTGMMVEAVDRISAFAGVPGYRIAGKTGTAQIPIPGGYDPEFTIASFVGFAPAYDPKFIVLVKIDRPRKSPWGVTVAAPVFKRIAEQLFLLLEIPPDGE